MNGQISEQPLAELLREISTKKLSGRLRVQHDRLAVVIYFSEGNLLYAAANVRTLRLKEYLTKFKVVTEDQLARFSDSSDPQLASTLIENKLVEPKTIREIQLKQIADVLRLPLLWTDGTWEFDHRSRLNETVDLRFEPATLFLEAARRLPAAFAASRLRNEKEVLSPNPKSASNVNQLQPKEGFILSRLDRSMTLRELVSVSGLSDTDALPVIYGLAVSDYIIREHWKSVFRDVQPKPSVEDSSAPQRQSPTERTQSSAHLEEIELLAFLERAESASTHYELLNIARDAAGAEVKRAYYDVARRFHPDRFRKKEGTQLHSRIESAFARITQAYETLEDSGSRATYDAKLAARSRSASRVAPPKLTVVPEPASIVSEDIAPNRERSEAQFREGLAALKAGQNKLAISHFASTVQAFPNEARYHAFYGHALSSDVNSRRLAEVELQAALRLDPNNPDYRTMLAQLYKALGFLRRARTEAERALEIAPNHEGARILLREI